MVLSIFRCCQPDWLSRRCRTARCGLPVDRDASSVAELVQATARPASTSWTDPPARPMAPRATYARWPSVLLTLASGKGSRFGFPAAAGGRPDVAHNERLRAVATG